MMPRILVINPGSTSTKIAVYRGEEERFAANLPLTMEDLEACPTINSQLDLRTDGVLNALRAEGIGVEELDAILARGGILPPMRHGAYVVDAALDHALREGFVLAHASNLGGQIAYRLAKPHKIPSWIYDPVSVDELSDVARLSGAKNWPRRSQVHALNTRAVARYHCEQHGLVLEEANLVVAHLGGGISINWQQGGRMVDIVNADEGSFSGNRSGGMPLNITAEIALQEGPEALHGYGTRHGGLIDYLGTADLRAIEERIEAGDAYAALVVEAMAYQIAKSIGSLVAVTRGRCDAILITGGMAHSKRLMGDLLPCIEPLGEVFLYPGEFEMEALMRAGLRLLRGEETARRIADEWNAK